MWFSWIYYVDITSELCPSTHTHLTGKKSEQTSGTSVHNDSVGF